MTEASGAAGALRSARLVVVSEKADETEETGLLLALMRALAPDLPVEVRFLLFAGGPSLEEFRAIAPTTVVWDLERDSRAARVERICFALRLRRMGYARRARRLDLDAWREGDVVYLHNVRALQVLRYLPRGVPPVLCHLPASTPPLRHFLRRRDRSLVTRRVDRFLVGHPDVGERLAGRSSVDTARVVLFPEYFRAVDAGPAVTRPGVGERRKALGITPDAVLVGAFEPAVGSRTEPLAAFAALLRHRLAGAAVEVLVVAPEEEQFHWLAHDLRQAGLADAVHVVTMSPDPYDRSLRDPSSYVDLCDLVVLWALDDGALHFSYEQEMRGGMPVACFSWSPLAELAGGAESGLVLAVADLADLADRVAAVVADPERLVAARATVIDAVEACYGPVPAARFLRRELADAAGWGSR